MNGQQTNPAAKYSDNVLSNDKRKPSRTTGNLPKRPPLKMENVQNRASLLHPVLSVQDGIEKVRSNEKRVYAVESSWKSSEFVMKVPHCYDHQMEHKNQCFSKVVDRSISRHPANDRLAKFRETLANDRIRESAAKLHSFKNICRSTQSVNESDDSVNELITKSRSLELLSENNRSPVNTLTAARMSWAASSNFYSPGQSSSTSQTSQPKLEFVSTPDTKLHETTDPVLPLDTKSAERRQSSGNNCFNEALQDYQKYQKIEEQKRKSGKPSIRPQNSNSHINTNGFNFNKQANGSNKSHIGLGYNMPPKVDEPKNTLPGVLWRNLKECANKEKL